MIVDVHTHLPTHPHSVPDSDVRIESVMRSGEQVRLTNSPADYLDAMGAVDRTVIFGVADRPWDPEHPFWDVSAWGAGMNVNDVAAAMAAMAPEKVVPFMSVHPLDPHVHDEYDRARDELGCRGIKLIPGSQDFDPLGPEALAVYARAQDDRLPMVFHSGTLPSTDSILRHGQPLLFDQIALAFPRLRIVLAHLGHPWHADTIAVIRKHPHVFADVSAQTYRPWSFWNGLRLFLEWGVLGKILFASDWPVAGPAETIAGLRAIPRFARTHHLPPIPEEEIEAIIHRDALSLLGLDPG